MRFPIHISRRLCPFVPLQTASTSPMQSSNSSERTLPAAVSKTASKEGLPDESSSNMDRDIEKGDSGAKDKNEVDQGGVDRRQTKEEDNVIGWDGPDDPQNPHNWTKTKKYTATVLYASMTFCITFASSVFSTATLVTAKEFGVPTEVMILGTSLFVLVCSSTYIDGLALTALNRVSPLDPSSGVHSPSCMADSHPFSLASHASSYSIYLSPSPRTLRQSYCVDSSEASLDQHL